MACRLPTERGRPHAVGRPSNVRGDVKMWTPNQGFGGWIKRPRRQSLCSRRILKLTSFLVVAVISFTAMLVISPAVSSVQALAARLPRKMGTTAWSATTEVRATLVWNQSFVHLADTSRELQTSFLEGSTPTEPNYTRQAINNGFCRRFTSLVHNSTCFPYDSASPFIEDVITLPENKDLILVRDATASGAIFSCIYVYGQIAHTTKPWLTKVLTDGRIAVTCSRPLGDGVTTGENQTFRALQTDEIALEMIGTGSKEGEAGQLILSVPEGQNQSTGLLQWNAPIVYNVQSTEEDVILYVKGLFNLRHGRRQDYTKLQNFRCIYDFGSTVVETAVTAAAMEVFRCSHPNRHLAVSVPVPTSLMPLNKARIHLKYKLDRLPSVAYYEPGPVEASQVAQLIAEINSADRRAAKNPSSRVEAWGGFGVEGVNVQTNGDPSSPVVEAREKHMICSCTMIWNVGKFLREWVLFNSDLGVEKFFLYDNNSEDELESVVRSLQHLNVTVTVWPWVKTQEAGFSHCAVQAQSECSWILFTDVDEFLFPRRWIEQTGEDPLAEGDAESTARLHDKPLRSLIGDTLEIGKHYDPHRAPKRMSEVIAYSTKPSPGVPQQVGQISFWCRNFGPSGLTSNPVKGVTQGYTCRDKKELRHKSLVRFPAITKSLRNLIHHFILTPEYKTLMLDPGEVVINHYKFQAWSEFKSKFDKRASTTVADWKEAKNLGSQDRPEGLGREAVKPSDWETTHCQVEDTALQDYIRRRYGMRNGGPGSQDNPTTMAWEVADHARNF